VCSGSERVSAHFSLLVCVVCQGVLKTEKEQVEAISIADAIPKHINEMAVSTVEITTVRFQEREP